MLKEESQENTTTTTTETRKVNLGIYSIFFGEKKVWYWHTLGKISIDIFICHSEMSDLLGSILDSMAKPPSIKNEQKEIMKRQKEQMIKRQAADKAKLNRFREEIEKKVSEFVQDANQQKYKFGTMDKVSRSIIHDVADIAGLTAFSFGDDEVDRHVMIFKKEFAPSDDELAAYRKGEGWDPEKAKEVAKQKMLEKESELNSSQLKDALPNSNYKEKYEKLLGKEAGKDAAKIAVPNKQFGFVPSDNKRDQRSIEQTLADIRAKKKQKIEPVAPETL